MAKAALWLLIVFLSAAFVVTVALRTVVAEMNARVRENALPHPVYVRIIEPKMRAEWARLANVPATMPTTLPASVNCSDDG